MKRERSHGFSERIGGGILVLLIAAGALLNARSEETAPAARMEVQGHLVCIPELMHARFGADLPTQHEHVLGFEDSRRRVFQLLRTKLSEALFADPAMREKELLLKGKVYPGTQVLDVTVMRSLREGQVYDLYYWCDICAIKSVIPGTCMCCQEDVVLKEVPWEETEP